MRFSNLGCFFALCSAILERKIDKSDESELLLIYKDTLCSNMVRRSTLKTESIRLIFRLEFLSSSQFREVTCLFSIIFHDTSYAIIGDTMFEMFLSEDYCKTVLLIIIENAKFEGTD